MQSVVSHSLIKLLSLWPKYRSFKATGRSLILGRHFGPELWKARKLHHFAGKAVDRPGWNNPLTGQEVRHGTDIAADGGKPGGHGFEQGAWNAFGAGRQDKQIGSREPAPNLISPPQGASNADSITDAKGSGKRKQALPVFTVTGKGEPEVEPLLSADGKGAN